MVDMVSNATTCKLRCLIEENILAYTFNSPTALSSPGFSHSHAYGGLPHVHAPAMVPLGHMAPIVPFFNPMMGMGPIMF